MGLFSRLFGSPSSIENQLKNIYVPMFQTTMGMSRSQAKRFFRHTLKRVKELSLKQGSINLPQNFGDILLEKESTDEKTKVMLAKKRKEGVRDEDIRWWWNMHDFERGMMSEIDNTTRTTMFIDNIAEGMKEEEAIRKGIIIRDTSYVAVLDSIFHETYPIDSIRYVPFADTVQFFLGAGEIVTGSKVKVKVFEAHVLNDVLFHGLDKQLIINYNAEREKIVGFPGLKVGSLTESTNNAGNWE